MKSADNGVENRDVKTVLLTNIVSSTNSVKNATRKKSIQSHDVSRDANFVLRTLYFPFPNSAVNIDTSFK